MEDSKKQQAHIKKKDQHVVELTPAMEIRSSRLAKIIDLTDHKKNRSVMTSVFKNLIISVLEM
jgi:hypothetical protein